MRILCSACGGGSQSWDYRSSMFRTIPASRRRLEIVAGYEQFDRDLGVLTHINERGAISDAQKRSGGNISGRGGEKLDGMPGPGKRRGSQGQSKLWPRIESNWSTALGLVLLAGPKKCRDAIRNCFARNKCSMLGFSDSPNPIMSGTITRHPTAVSGVTNSRYR